VGTYDLGVLARLEHLPELVAKARAVNRRLLMIERAGQGCAIETVLSERAAQPYVGEGRRTGALRFGDPRAMALAGALCVMVHAVSGFSNKSLRSLVAGLLGAGYTSAQMTYDLCRLRLHGLITRLPGSHTYVTTPQGLRVAVFYSKLAARVLGPLLAADQPPAPIEVRRALATLDRAVSDLRHQRPSWHRGLNCHNVPASNPQERLARRVPRYVSRGATGGVSVCSKAAENR
jgi:hypothetical protein